MFSNNNRISTRQVFRLFVFDFVGESTLILPSQLAAFAGNDGLASIVLGGIMGSLYLWYLAYVLKKMETDLVTYMERILPTWMKKIFLVLLLVYFTGMAGYGAYIFSDVIQKGLIAGERHYVHLSADEATARKVGARHGSPVILTVKAQEMAKRGIPFWQAENGVWLTSTVAVEFLEW